MTLDPQSINPVEVEREIVRFIGLLEEATQSTAKRGRAAAEAEADHRVAFAHAILATEGTVAERDAQAVIATQTEYRAMRIAERRLEATKDAARSMREQLGALRSIMANVRALLENA